MTTNRILLLGGLWLDASAWDGVVAHLGRADAARRDAVAVTLPGQGDGNTSATLDDQLAAVLAAVDAEPGPVVVVGHSGSCSLAWMTADARPEKVAKVVLIGGFPWADGQQYFPFIPPTDGAVRFPGWEAFEGPDSADIDEQTRAAFAAAAIPVPEGVTGATVRLSDDRRFDVPIVVVCPEFSREQARGWIDSGDAPEVARAKHVELVDIDSGHWPMLTRPAELARILAQV
ncbi:alpha/beta fold hydrolase [Actinoplanes flavus]|uniref:Alpha/beta hydrolase n=1 Tax=Actinoplanes flavus TaxID=2820290 RepID=A0ABS3UX14_9ACTN|nr:alpha/beta hydrolase [Actinoplanes flavus]MBO3743124.1 alpha/beta hydrolase [Actinoplanes flavus]